MKIALCGSTRFRKEFESWNGKLGLAGHVVYSLSCFGREAADLGKDEAMPLFSEEEKIILDLVHLRKIQESEAIVVINPGSYIGFSTKREIMWAIMLNKLVYVLEAPESIDKIVGATYDSYSVSDLI